MKIVVLGETGQIGRALQEALSRDKIPFMTFGRDTMDLNHPESLNHLNGVSFDVLINAAAYTAVDKAEENPDEAFRVNADSVKILAEMCRLKNALLVHYSTDYVYHASGSAPIKETDPCSPQNTYAKSKWAGEEFIRESGCQYIIIRTSWVFAPWGHNFVKTISRLAGEKDQLRVVCDQTGSPSYAPDVAEATLKVTQKCLSTKTKIAETIHICNSGYVSWYEWAMTIVADMAIPPKIEPIRYEEYGSKTKRPSNSRLDTAKLKKEYGLAMRPWQEALQECNNRMKDIETNTII